MWGLPIPKEVLDARGEPRAYWGARAIFKPNSSHPIDILHDRQNYTPEGRQHSLLLNWLNHEVMPDLRKDVKKLTTMSDGVLEYNRGTMYYLRASPKSSAGYLYIGAWRYDAAEATYENDEPTPGKKWSGTFPIPPKGTRVNIKMNQFGPGTVYDYFTEYDWQGVRVILDKQPKWHAEQNPGQNWAMVMGIEMQLLDEPKEGK